jgi:hypothetical protein
VLRYEAELLAQKGRPDLAVQIVHVSKAEGDGAGYDILSFEADGKAKYIEVKTTTGSSDSDFFVSAAEVAFANQHATDYWLYRVFNYDKTSDTGSVYIIPGPLSTQFILVPMQFRVTR